MLQSQALKVIGESVAKCTLCPELTEFRTENNYLTVPGEGNSNAKFLFLGEAPGKDEAESGRPFVGRAGKLLNNILSAVGIHREDIFIANICKCRPPGNRVPTEEEARNCRKYLELQIKCVNPEWIVCLGKTAACCLLGFSERSSLGSMRGVHDYDGRKVVVTYHPSFLLRPGNAWAKEEVWLDLQHVIRAFQHKEKANTNDIVEV